MEDLQNPHVHFEQDDVVEHQNKMLVKQSKPDQVDVHVGFLQIHHQYEIQVPISSDFLPKSDNVVPELTDIPSISRILKIEAKDDNLVNFTFEVIPTKDKLYREKVKLVDANDKTKQCTIVLHCRVLGKGKGTPMLKDGIKCTGALPDPNDSESQSDWQGF